MKHTKYIIHFCEYIIYRLQRDNLNSVAIYSCKDYQLLSQAIQSSLSAQTNCTIFQTPDINKINQQTTDSLIIIFNNHYDELAQAMQAEQSFFEANWKRTLKLTGFKEYFAKVYAEPPQELSAFTKKAAAIFNQTSKVTYNDQHGSHLELSVTKEKDFTLIDGFNGEDMVPGEIAKKPNDANGHIVFTGTFLSLIPFALKHGLVKAGEFTFDIEHNRITNLGGSNTELVKDFQAHFSKHPDNNRIDELGIGTNKSVNELYGLNCVFEERHAGLHLGFGGVVQGTLHCDFLFQAGNLFCDDQPVYQDGRFII